MGETVSNEVLFDMLSAAYRRGANWMMDNAASPEFIAKAADDYADRILSERTENTGFLPSSPSEGGR